MTTPWGERLRRPAAFPKRAWYIMLTVCCAFGLVVGLVFAGTADAAPATPAVRPTVAAADSGITRICSPRPPEYPGCSAQQVHDLTTLRKARSQYYNAKWGRTGKAMKRKQKSRLSRGEVRTLQRMYRHAYRKYVRQHSKMGRRAKYPPIDDWWGFYGGSGCSQTEGQTRNWSYYPSVYCHGGPRTLDTAENVFRETGKATLVCGGTGLVAGSTAAASTAVFIGPGSGAAGLAAGSATTSACLVGAFGKYVIPDSWKFWD